MKTTINLLGNKITLESIYACEKHSLWSSENAHTHHKIIVTHNNNTIEFDYWSSLVKPTIESEKDLISAFYSFLLDNVEYMTYEDFLSEYGYGDNNSARITYEGCMENTKKLSELELLEEHYDLINELQNQYDF